jgi:SAM-dependent methyltransferase
MTQLTTGLRSILSSPAIYELLQVAMGAKSGREDFVHKDLRLTGGESIVDVGCGPAALLAHLPETVSYVGFDPSEAYVVAARNRYGNRAKFIHGVFGHEEATANKSRFDVAILSGVLHHLSDHEVVDTLTNLATTIRPHGKVVTLDPTFVPKQNPVARLLIANDRGRNVRTPEQYLALARQALPNSTGYIRHRRWVPYTHWIMQLRNDAS